MLLFTSHYLQLTTHNTKHHHETQKEYIHVCSGTDGISTEAIFYQVKS